MTPRVSVVIPSFNTPDAYLAECLSGLTAQTVSEWEAIVVDDGSSRGSVEATVAAARDPRIRNVRQENQGMGGARNAGVALAAADLILTLDADDRLDPTFLSVALSAFDGSAIDCVFMDSQCFGQSSEVRYFPDPLPPPCPYHPLFPDCGVVVRRSLWLGIGGYTRDSELAGAEWWDFWLRATAKGMRVRHIPRALYLYRTHHDSASVTSSLHNEHRNRAALYRRHRRLFEAFAGPCDRGRHDRRSFLAAGLAASSRASLYSGQRGRAIRLALRAAALDPSKPSLVLLAKALVSGSAASRPLQGLRRRMRM